MIVKRTAPCILCFGDILIYPGVNNLSPKQEKEIREKKHFSDTFDELVKNGNLEVIERTTGDSLAEAVSGMNADRAAIIIRECLSLSELRKVVESDKRKSIIEAAEAQIAMINKPPADKK